MGRWSTLLTSFALLLSSSAFGDEAPTWTQDHSRRVIGGDLVHFGSGTGNAPSSAQRRADAMAVRNVALECGGVFHRDIAVWERYSERDYLNGGYRAYARASVSMQSCDEAKSANEEQRKKLTSAALLEEQAKAAQADEPIRVPTAVERSQVAESIEAGSEPRRREWIISVPTLWSGGTFNGPSAPLMMTGVQTQWLPFERLGLSVSGMGIWNFGGDAVTSSSRTSVSGWRAAVGFPVYLNRAIYLEPEATLLSSQATVKNSPGSTSTPQLLQTGYGGNVGANVWIPLKSEFISLGLSFKLGVHRYQGDQGFEGRSVLSAGFGLSLGL